MKKDHIGHYLFTGSPDSERCKDHGGNQDERKPSCHTRRLLPAKSIVRASQ